MRFWSQLQVHSVRYSRLQHVGKGVPKKYQGSLDVITAPFLVCQELNSMQTKHQASKNARRLICDLGKGLGLLQQRALQIYAFLQLSPPLLCAHAATAPTPALADASIAWKAI